MRFAVLAGTLTIAASAPAQAPFGGPISPEKFTVSESRGHKAPMRDGVRLSVDVYRPDAPGRYPAILTITPYDNNGRGFRDRGKWFARRGYVVAIADSRGRYDSEGEWDPFAAVHKLDGHDLVEWLAKQPWCNGKVGMMGLSYMGWTQWWTATQAPPPLKAIVPEVAPPSPGFRNSPYQEGILVSWLMDWASAMAGRTAQAVGDAAYGGWAATRDRDYMPLPYMTLNERRGSVDSPWFTEWLKHNTSATGYWKRIDYQSAEDYARVTVPSLNVTGWYDANYPGSPANYLGVKKHGKTPEARQPRLVIGPWVHIFNKSRQLAGYDFGPDAVIDWDGYVCRWFDRYLKDEDNGIDKEPPVYVFVGGRNRWSAETDWPLPRMKPTKYYLHSGGKANRLNGDGTLSVVPPGDEPADHYTYDPDRPTRSPFTGGHIDGPSDCRAAAMGEDVLVYTTPPLTEELELIGPVEGRLFAATSARDTDWMMRLVDVAPDGSARFLCDGVIRARCRDPKNHGKFQSERIVPIEPNQPLEYTLEFWRGVGHVFLKGHRVRVEVSSAYFPYYLRNPNAADDNLSLATRTTVAKQTVFHSAERPSHVVLPLIPPRP